MADPDNLKMASPVDAPPGSPIGSGVLDSDIGR